MDKYKYKRRQVRELQDDLDTMSRTYDSLTSEENSIELVISESEGKVTMSKKQLDEQHNKLDRVSKQLVRYARDIRSAKGKKSQTTEEEDIDLREMSEFNKTISSTLFSSVQNYPDALSTLSSLLYQSNIPIPTGTGTPQGGSRSSSRASSVASLLSVKSDTARSIQSVTLGADFSPSGSAKGSTDSSPRSVASSSPRSATGGMKGASRPTSAASRGSKGSRK